MILPKNALLLASPCPYLSFQPKLQHLGNSFWNRAFGVQTFSQGYFRCKGASNGSGLPTLEGTCIFFSAPMPPLIRDQVKPAPISYEHLLSHFPRKYGSRTNPTEILDAMLIQIWLAYFIPLTQYLLESISEVAYGALILPPNLVYIPSRTWRRLTRYFQRMVYDFLAPVPPSQRHFRALLCVVLWDPNN